MYERVNECISDCLFHESLFSQCVVDLHAGSGLDKSGRLVRDLYGDRWSQDGMFLLTNVSSGSQTRSRYHPIIGAPCLRSKHLLREIVVFISLRQMLHFRLCPHTDVIFLKFVANVFLLCISPLHLYLSPGLIWSDQGVGPG